MRRRVAAPFRPLALALFSPWRTRPARPLARTRAVATTGVRSTARPAQMMGDWCRQVSWLAAHAHHLLLPAGFPAVALGVMLAAHSCGGSRGLEETTPRTAFPFPAPSTRALYLAVLDLLAFPLSSMDRTHGTICERSATPRPTKSGTDVGGCTLAKFRGACNPYGAKTPGPVTWVHHFRWRRTKHPSRVELVISDTDAGASKPR